MYVSSVATDYPLKHTIINIQSIMTCSYIYKRPLNHGFLALHFIIFIIIIIISFFLEFLSVIFWKEFYCDLLIDQIRYQGISADAIAGMTALQLCYNQRLMVNLASAVCRDNKIKTVLKFLKFVCKGLAYFLAVLFGSFPCQL